MGRERQIILTSEEETQKNTDRYCPSNNVLSAVADPEFVLGEGANGGGANHWATPTTLE